MTDEIIDHCGGCGKPLTETQIAYAYLDNDPVMCADCAPTPEEAEAGRVECKEAYGADCENSHCGNYRTCWPDKEAA